ncbi:MAG: PEP-CTERM sorting domain-containing protein [Symploca sp. SIO2E6]|nr:PEP-CTERM sorting domain-containing protein [Symploca sp. SIO2E6]
MKPPKLRKLGLTLTSFAALGFVTSLPATAAEFRSIDGSGNNIANHDWGESDIQLLRLLSPDYEDGISAPAGANRPSARAISNAVASQTGSVTNSLNASDWLWQWGQFLDHDLDLTEGHKPEEPFNISVPTGDPFFDPFGTGTQEIGLNRSIYDTATGTGIGNPRQQINEITAYIDASNVYGSDPVRASFLRTNDNTGKLKTSAGDLLPFNTALLPNAQAGNGPIDPSLFIAGDARANEQIGLASTHTLFVREHNRLAEEIAAADPTLSGEEIYQRARKIVGAQIQAITYNEFLPLLLGDGALGAYSGYDDTVNAGISNEFSTAAFRVGHTMLSPELQRINNDGTSPGSIALQDAFFTTTPILDEGIDSILLGLASQKAQEVDTLIVDDVRNFLFGPPGAGGFDLASLNIQRGRDHGLPGYNQARIGLGLGAVTSFADITSDISVQNKLASIYDTVDDIDLWIGGLAENHFNGGIVGELFHTIIADQFTRTRNGDRFFYLNDDHLLSLAPNIGNTTLSDIIRRNSTITNIQDNAFVVTEDVPEPSVIFSLLVLGTLGVGSQLKRRVKSSS